MMILTRKQAIDEHCRQCIYDPLPGNGSWRMQVQNCTSKKCPLYNFRPVTTELIEKRKNEKFEKMSESQKIAYKKKQEKARDSFHKE